jgi:hypothetical protein
MGIRADSVLLGDRHPANPKSVAREKATLVVAAARAIATGEFLLPFAEFNHWRLAAH